MLELILYLVLVPLALAFAWCCAMVMGLRLVREDMKEHGVNWMLVGFFLVTANVWLIAETIWAHPWFNPELDPSQWWSLWSFWIWVLSIPLSPLLLNAARQAVGRLREQRAAKRTARDQSDEAILARAEQYTKRILSILPGTGWEDERRAFSHTVKGILPDLLEHRAQLAQDILAVEEILDRQTKGPDKVSDESRRRTDGNLARLREKHAQVEEDLRDTLSFLNTVEPDVRVALHDHAVRTNLNELFENLIQSIKRNAKAQAEADREVQEVAEGDPRVIQMRRAATRKREGEPSS